MGSTQAACGILAPVFSETMVAENSLLCILPSRANLTEKLAFLERTKSTGTVKLALTTIDTRTKHPAINSRYTLARADHRHRQVLGLCGQQSGSVQEEMVTKTGEDNSVIGTARLASRTAFLSR